MKRSSDDVTKKKIRKPVRSVAKLYSICCVNLYRFCKKRKILERKGSSELPRVGYHSEEHEKELEYLLRAVDAFYGLCPREVSRIKSRIRDKIES